MATGRMFQTAIANHNLGDIRAAHISMQRDVLQTQFAENSQKHISGITEQLNHTLRQ